MTDTELVPESQRSNDVVASLAVTLDGFVCRPDGSVDYLDKYPMEDFNFDAWSERVGALVMGRTTYTQTAQWGWGWGDTPTLVLTSATDLVVPTGANVTFESTPTGEAISAFRRSTDKRIWVFGGGKVVTAALASGAVDTLDITIVPEAIGEGLPLFTSPFAGPLRPIETTPYSNGAVRLVYDVNPEGLTR